MFDGQLTHDSAGGSTSTVRMPIRMY